MNRLRNRSLFATVCPSIAVATLALSMASFASAQDRDRGIVAGTQDAPGTDVDYGTARVDLDFPIETVAALLHDYANFEEFLPHFQTSRVLARRGNRARVYIEVTAISGTVTLWAQTEARSRERDGGGYIIEARIVGDTNMEAFQVRWILEPLDNGQRTRMRFRLLAEPDLPLPSSIVTRENERFASRVCRAVRERLEAQAGS